MHMEMSQHEAFVSVSGGFENTDRNVQDDSIYESGCTARLGKSTKSGEVHTQNEQNK